MKFINLTDNNLENLVESKINIVNYLLANNKIKESMSLQDFIDWLSVDKQIFYINKTFIPFRFINCDNNEYLFYCGYNNETYINKLYNIILSCDNKLDLILEPLTVDDMIKDNIVKEPDTYFIINNVSYKLK